MKGFLARFKFWGRSPLTIVEVVIGIVTIVAGVYILSPALVYSTTMNGASPLVATLGSQLGISLFGGFFLLSGLVMLYGIFKRNYRIRSAGLFMNILARTYGLIGYFLVTGILPLTWLSSLTILIIAVICWVVVRGFIHRGVTKEI